MLCEAANARLQAFIAKEMAGVYYNVFVFSRNLNYAKGSL